MPALKNPRYESFCQHRAAGKTCDESYKLAGYRPDRHHAGRLATYGHIVARIAELQAKAASGAPERRIELPAATDAPIRVVWGPQDDEFADETKKLFVDSEWKISATSDRMGYRLEGPVLRHLHGHNIVSDGTVNGSLQVPGNGQPIVLMRDRGTSGGYPKIATVISADFGRFAQIPAGRAFRFRAVSMAEAQAEARKFAALLRSLPERLRAVESVDLNIDALHDANVAGHAVSAVDAGTWHAASPADASGPD